MSAQTPEESGPEPCRFRIFISYRRDDSDDEAQALCAALRERFGERCVFFDIEEGPGPFTENIKDFIKHADVVVPIIGKRWVELRRSPVDGGAPDDGEQVQWHKEDFVRLELQLALESKLQLVPVFIDGVMEFPPEAEMPEELHPLRGWVGYPLVSRLAGQDVYRQSLDRICKMVDRANRRGQDRALRSRVKDLIALARAQRREQMMDGARIAIARARAAAKEIDDELIQETAFEELRPELEIVMSHEQDLLEDVGHLVAKSREEVETDQRNEAGRILTSAREKARQITDEELRGKALSEVSGLEPSVVEGEQGVRALLERARRELDDGRLDEARTTLRSAREVAGQSIEADAARAELVLAIASLEDELRDREEAINRGVFDTPTELSGESGTVRGQNASAVKEPGEPDHAGNSGGKSVWYRWTAPRDGTATIDTFGSDFDTLLAVYRGSQLTDLETIAANDDAEGIQSRVSFPVREGEEYRIAVDGYGGATGHIVLNWELVDPASNSAFDTPTELSGESGTVRGQNASAVKEPGEPDHAGSSGGKSVWYRWTAPRDGTATIDTFGSDFDTLLAVYRGSQLTDLETIAANDDAEGIQSRVSFPVREGEEYRIAVDGYGGAFGAITLNWGISANVSLAELVRAAGLEFTEARDGVLAIPFAVEHAGEVVVAAKDLTVQNGIVLFYVTLPKFSGFGTRTFLQTMLKLSYALDYVKAMRQPDDSYGLAVEADPATLTPSVCGGLIGGLVALADVKGEPDLIGSWSERRKNCESAQSAQIAIDAETARAELQSMLEASPLPIEVQPYVTPRVISLIATIAIKPGRNKDKLRGLLDLNRVANVAKVGLDDEGRVKLLYEVPQITPDLLERAGPQLLNLHQTASSLLL